MLGTPDIRRLRYITGHGVGWDGSPKQLTQYLLQNPSASFYTSPFYSTFVLQSNLGFPDLDYPDFSIIRTFSLVQFGHEYLLVTIKIPSHILFKTTALKGAVK